MGKRRVRVGISFFILIIFCIFMKNIFLLTNYFVALIIHEFGHYMSLKKRQYKLNNITVSIAGIKMELEGTVRDEDEFAVAVAGPAANLFAVILCIAGWWVFPQTYAFTSTLVSCNVFLALFNLMPVKPLDGSRVFNSIVLSRLNKKNQHIAKLFINIIFTVVFLGLFIISLTSSVNIFFGIMAIFFLFNIFSFKGVTIAKYNTFARMPKRPTTAKIIYLPPEVDMLKVSNMSDKGAVLYFYKGDLYTKTQLIDVLPTKNM